MTEEEVKAKLKELSKDFTDVLYHDLWPMWHENTIFNIYYKSVKNDVIRQYKEEFKGFPERERAELEAKAMFWPDFVMSIFDTFIRSQCSRIRSINESQEKYLKNNETPPRSLRRVLQKLELFVEEMENDGGNLLTRKFYFDYKEFTYDLDEAKQKEKALNKEFIDKWKASGCPNKTFAIPITHPSHIPEFSEDLHDVFDELSGTDHSKRSPEDKVDLKVIRQKNKEKLKSLKKVIGFCNKAVAHAEERKISISFEDIRKSHELIYETALFIKNIVTPMTSYGNQWSPRASRDEIDGFRFLGVTDSKLISEMWATEYERLHSRGLL